MSPAMPDRASNRWRLTLGAVVVLGLAALGLLLVHRTIKSPGVPLLLNENGAHWIRYAEPPVLKRRENGAYYTSFRVSFTQNDPLGPVPLVMRSLRSADVWVDDRLIHKRRERLQDWKQAETVDLAGTGLDVGRHMLRIEVYNRNGPRLLLAHCAALDLHTDVTWEVREGLGAWTAATRATEPIPTELGANFETPLKAILGVGPYLAIIFAAVFLWSLIPAASRPGPLRGIVIQAKHARWVFIAAWVVLAGNNILKLNLAYGFDVQAHVNYFEFIRSNWALPIATDGWQMFQAPLYYVVSVFPHALFVRLYGFEGIVIQLLRVVPLLCGVLQVEICYRTVRHVYPEHENLQIAGTALGAFLPMNLYMSQYVGNEPMAAVMTGLVILAVLRLLDLSEEHDLSRTCAVLGGLLGLAILTKVTAILLTPIMLLVVAYKSLRGKVISSSSIKATVRLAGIMLLFTALVCGWFFARNQLRLGTPLVAAGGDVQWWQDPGYRTLNQFYSFGESLRRPIASGSTGLWDSLYSTCWLDGSLSAAIHYKDRPPWNYRFVLAGAWLAMAPMALMLLGGIRVLLRPHRSSATGTLFALACLATYVCAIAYLYLTVPAYSVGKATYLLGLTPCMALLAAVGAQSLSRWRFVQAAAFAALACCSVSAYAAYFIVG